MHLDNITVSALSCNKDLQLVRKRYKEGVILDLYKEILMHALSQQRAEIIFPDLHMDTTQIVELECYKALQKIKAIIEDDSLADDSCFKKIEEIVCSFEEMGSSGGGRHDFG